MNMILCFYQNIRKILFYIFGRRFDSELLLPSLHEVWKEDINFYLSFLLDLHQYGSNKNSQILDLTCLYIPTLLEGSFKNSKIDCSHHGRISLKKRFDLNLKLLR